MPVGAVEFFGSAELSFWRRNSCEGRAVEEGCLTVNYDNVILFGAGASADAGIPLLGNFVDKMWEYGIRGRAGKEVLSEEDRRLFQRANEIRFSLESYNSRANFNLRNLEDVLSLLAFETFANDPQKVNYQVWVDCICRTIELSTSVRDVAESERFKKIPGKYHEFWHALLEEGWAWNPALLTFNYDLTLERTLCEYYSYRDRGDIKPKHKAPCSIDYALAPYSFHVQSVNASLDGAPGFTSKAAYGMRPKITIPYLKLHGSLNWSRNTVAEAAKSQNVTPSNKPTMTAQDPLILPPVFNKMDGNDLTPVWSKGLEILRQAKHLIIVGYSLPRTDIYMQYFLKAAIGPNSHLQRVFVFNPVLFEEGAGDEAMRERFQECFSKYFQEQIIFQPWPSPNGSRIRDGSFQHFVYTLQQHRDQIFFTR